MPWARKPPAAPKFFRTPSTETFVKPYVFTVARNVRINRVRREAVVLRKLTAISTAMISIGL
jgi:DNA-directed RNA polymerase specialized sigma24 family protein